MKPIVSLSPTSPTRFLNVLCYGALAASALLLSALLLSASQLGAQTQTTVVYQSNFTTGVDGWLNANSSSGLSTTNGSLRSINSNALFLKYFAPTTLGIGDSIQLELNVQLLGNGTTVPQVDAGLRFGLLNSNGDHVTVGGNGGFGYSNDAFKNNTGYRFTTNPGGSTSNSNGIARRVIGDGENVNPVGGDGKYWNSFTGSRASAQLAAGQFYPVVITIARTDATTLGFTYSLNGVTVSAADTSAASFTFDTLVLNKTTASLGNILVKDVTISYNQIPEAGQTAAAIGAIAIITVGLMARRRKSRS